MKKTIAIIAVLSMIFVAAAPVGASAQTTAELQAQITSLLNVLNQLQAKISATTGGTTAPSQSFVFTNNLTIGSRGQDVTQLQMFLVARGFLTMPQGVAFGYFGTLTQRALGQFQSSQSISPTAGFFGPITRTRINSILATQIPVTTPTTTPSSTGITTLGVEGDMTITTSNVGLQSTIHESDQAVPILGMKISARQSDIDVQRVKIDLGNSTLLYNKILSTLYVTDGTNVLGSVDLNSTNVVKESGRYFVTITGFHYLVPKNTDKNLIIKADVRSSIDTTNQNTSLIIQLADGGVRGIDGAGIDHFAPITGSSISRNISAQKSLAESATLRISLDSSSPRSQEVIANSGANNNELDRLTLLSFDAKAEKDNVTITDLQVNISKTGIGAATASSTIYLYDGSTEIDNASVTNGVATFTDLNYTISQDTTKTLTIKTDIRNANANPANFIVTIPSNGIIADNSIGDQLSTNNITGSATGYQIGVRSVGSQVTLVNKSANTTGAPQSSATNNFSTSALTATFNVQISAVGGDIILGTPASTTPAFGADSFVIYRNGVATTIDSSATSISYSAPSGSNTSGLTNSFAIPDGTTVTMPVTMQLRGRVADTAITSGLYAIGLEKISWVAGGTLQLINFMAGNTDWRTNDVSFP